MIQYISFGFKYKMGWLALAITAVSTHLLNQRRTPVTQLCRNDELPTYFHGNTCRSARNNNGIVPLNSRRMSSLRCTSSCRESRNARGRSLTDIGQHSSQQNNTVLDPSYVSRLHRWRCMRSKSSRISIRTSCRLHSASVCTIPR